jgi:hypothetical protein
MAGNGYGYDIANGEATMTITLFSATQKTVTIVYNDGSGEQPAAGITASIFAEGGTGHDFASANTNVSGVATLNLKDGLTFYNYSASIATGGTTYSISGSSATVAGIPAKWLLTSTPQ